MCLKCLLNFSNTKENQGFLWFLCGCDSRIYYFIAQIKLGPLQNYASGLEIEFAAGIIEIGALGLEQWPREVKNRILVCQRDIHVLCICILYMYSVYVFCICTMYMYYVYVKNNNNNNNNNPRVLGARGNLER